MKKKIAGFTQVLMRTPQINFGGQSVPKNRIFALRAILNFSSYLLLKLIPLVLEGFKVLFEMH